MKTGPVLKYRKRSRTVFFSAPRGDAPRYDAGPTTRPSPIRLHACLPERTGERQRLPLGGRCRNAERRPGPPIGDGPPESGVGNGLRDFPILPHPRPLDKNVPKMW